MYGLNLVHNNVEEAEPWYWQAWGHPYFVRRDIVLYMGHETYFHFHLLL